MSSHEGFCGLFTKNQSSRVPTCAWQEYLGQSRLILASFPQRSRRPMCQRQADQVDMIMFRPGDPLNFSWHSHGVSQAGGWRVGGRDHVSPGNRVYFGWCSTGVLSDHSCPGWQAGGGVDLPYHVLMGNRVNIAWLLLCVFPADGVRVARAGRPGRRDHVHVAGKLRLAFALDLSWEACKFRLAFARGLAGQRSQSCRGTVVVVVVLL